MKKFNGEKALNGAPVRLRNGQKAYIEKYNEGAVFVYSGYVDDENKTITSWTKEGMEYCFVESKLDIVSMWREENENSVTEANLEANTEAEENIFEKALRNNLQLRCKKQDFEKYYYCIAKTENIDYLLENKKDGTIERLSSFVEGLDWSVVEHKIPKAFMPKEGEEFWFIHTMKNRTVSHSNYCDNDVYYNGLASAGLAFRTKEEATQALHFLLSNIEVNNGEEQK